MNEYSHNETVLLNLPGEVDTHQHLHDSHANWWFRADKVFVTEVNGEPRAYFGGPRVTKNWETYATGQKCNMLVELAPQLYAEHRALIWTTASQHYQNMVLKFQHMADTAERNLQ